MRRLALLALGVAAAAPLFAAAPASASTVCASQYRLPGRQPYCTVFCALTLDLDDPCWSQD
ncbi:MAG TPA: hypothetical protein VF519_13785 [Mycobacteriales bacterium]|jgi:hypothetical protein